MTEVTLSVGALEQLSSNTPHLPGYTDPTLWATYLLAFLEELCPLPQLSPMLWKPLGCPAPGISYVSFL